MDPPAGATLVSVVAFGHHRLSDKTQVGGLFVTRRTGDLHETVTKIVRSRSAP